MKPPEEPVDQDQEQRAAFEAYVKGVLEAGGQAAPPEKVRDVADICWAVGFKTPPQRPDP
jgi:hypothetical protein